jgi:hypothetical protein
VTDPEPADVPVNTTEQLVTPAVVERIQLGELKLPPVVPAVSVNVTVPVADFEAVVVSTTVAVTEAVQLVPPNAMLQLTAPTPVDVLSFATVIVLDVPELVLSFESPP